MTWTFWANWMIWLLNLLRVNEPKVQVFLFFSLFFFLRDHFSDDVWSLKMEGKFHPLTGCFLLQVSCLLCVLVYCGGGWIPDVCSFTCSLGSVLMEIRFLKQTVGELEQSDQQIFGWNFPLILDSKSLNVSLLSRAADPPPPFFLSLPHIPTAL